VAPEEEEEDKNKESSFYDNDSKYMSTICGKMQGFLMSQQVEQIFTSGLFTVKLSLPVSTDIRIFLHPSLAQQPNAGLGHFILQESRSHAITRHNR
jgi:hypothetical protein